MLCMLQDQGAFSLALLHAVIACLGFAYERSEAMEHVAYLRFSAPFSQHQARFAVLY
jgi:hypothetical protein